MLMELKDPAEALKEYEQSQQREARALPRPLWRGACRGDGGRREGAGVTTRAWFKSPSKGEPRADYAGSHVPQPVDR